MPESVTGVSEFHPSAANLGDQAKLALQESTMVQNISRGKHA